ncbi:MAG: hypothetical protein KDE31_33665, partial [Caldilineaceae bacterium]|nr:hypothetical protein [Caldilineaceae bacterium]
PGEDEDDHDPETIPVEQILGAIGNYVWVDENSDGYQDAGEPGIANVRVVLYDDEGNLVAETRTDSSGHYLFPDLPLGDYFVNVDESTLPEGMTQTPPSTLEGADFGNQDQSDDPTNGDYGYPATITQAVPENLTADFGYNANPQPEVDGGDGLAALGDRIWIDCDGDGAQDPGEIGVAGVEVTLYGDPDGDGIYETILATETTDENGFYLFAGLEAGAYVVEVTDSSSASHDVLDSASYEQTGDPDHFGRPGLDNDNLSTVPVVLAPGDIFLNVDFGYQPTGALLGSIGDTLWFDADADGNGPALPAVDGVDAENQGAGTEDDGGEYGIPGVSVALIADRNDNGTWEAGEPIIATVMTDERGQYFFTGLPLDDGSGDASYLVWVNDTANVLAGLHPTYDYDNGTSAPDGLSARVLSTTEPDARDQDFGYTP